MKYKLLEQYRNADWMLKNRFRYSEKFSSKDEEVYLKTFPVWRQGDTITLEARILVTLETGEAQVDVHDLSFKGRYAPYYLRQTYYTDMLRCIDERINAELDKYKIIIEEDEKG